MSATPAAQTTLDDLDVDPRRVAVLERPGAPPIEEQLVALGVEVEDVVPSAVRGWSHLWLPIQERSVERVEELARRLADRGEGFYAAAIRLGAEGRPLWPTPDVLARFRAGVARETQEEVLRDAFRAAEMQAAWGGMPDAWRIRTEVRSGEELLHRVSRLRQRSDVAWAEPDSVFVGRAVGVPDEEPNFGDLWALHNTGQYGGVPGIDLGAVGAWEWTTGDPEVRVVVLDTGVQLDHPDLGTAPSRDFTTDGGEGGPMNSCDNHGTAVAGCIAAAVENGLGVVGVAPACRVASARIGIANEPCDGTWTGQSSWTVEALGWAAESGARVTNNSNAYETAASAAVAAAYAHTRSEGIVHFASAGNEGVSSLVFPARLPSVNAVGAIDSSGSLADWAGGCASGSGGTNRGAGIDLVAPGEDIATTDRTGADGFTSSDLVCIDGTSFASPYAAGVAALALARNGFLSADELEWIVHQTCDDLGVAGYEEDHGWGLPDASKVVEAAGPGSVSRISIASVGDEGDGWSWSSPPSISADGRFVAFSSEASNLVPDDRNGCEDVFVHDRLTGDTERVSVSTSGSEGDLASTAPSISADGRLVAFQSLANNLDSGDGFLEDVFVHDRASGTTTHVSVDSSGTAGFGPSTSPALSADGRYVAFQSEANNLVDEDTNFQSDIFVRDLQAGDTTRVSVDSMGLEAHSWSWRPSVSGDGRYVAFESRADNLVLDDRNSSRDAFVHDRQSGATERVSVSSGGLEGNGTSAYTSLSADGRYVAFESGASNLVLGDGNAAIDVFLRDRWAASTIRLSVASTGLEGDAGSFAPSLSADGSHVAFASEATNLVEDDTNGSWDVFVREVGTATTTRASTSAMAEEANDSSDYPAISADSRFVAFASWATNLVPWDTDENGIDVFVRDRGQTRTDLDPHPWEDLGSGLAGSTGVPLLQAHGAAAPSSTVLISLGNAAPAAVSVLFVGLSRADLPILGGVLVPYPDDSFVVLLDGFGTEELVGKWPQAPAGTQIWFQAVALDAGAPFGAAMSNALVGTQQ